MLDTAGCFMGTLWCALGTLARVLNTLAGIASKIISTTASSNRGVRSFSQGTGPKCCVFIYLLYLVARQMRVRIFFVSRGQTGAFSCTLEPGIKTNGSNCSVRFVSFVFLFLFCSITLDKGPRTPSRLELSDTPVYEQSELASEPLLIPYSSCS